MKQFPKNFLWGAATSAYQVEGAALMDGKKESMQDINNQGGQFADASVTSDHYHRMKEDVALMKELGMNCYRFSIAWARVLPDGVGEVNQKGLQFYHDLIDELLANGIEPIPTLYHYDMPMALVEKYDGWVDRQSIFDFAEFAELIFKEFGHKVKKWISINEQSIIVQYWTKKNYVPEKYLNDARMRYQINHHMHLADKLATKLCHELVEGGTIGPALGYDPIYPLTSKPEDARAAMNAQDLRNQYFLDMYLKGFYTESAFRYLKEHDMQPLFHEEDEKICQSAMSDFIAINYYSSMCAKAPKKDATRQYQGVNISGVKGQFSGEEIQPDFYEMVKNPNLDTTDWDWTIDPTGLEYTLRDIATRYNVPLMITENGMGAYDTLEEDGRIHDHYRIDYLQKHVIAMKNAIDNGVELSAYCPWSYIDLLSTSNGYKKRYGFVYVNRTDEDEKDLNRYKKDSFYWYQQVIATNGAKLAVDNYLVTEH